MKPDTQCFSEKITKRAVTVIIGLSIFAPRDVVESGHLMICRPPSVFDRLVGVYYCSRGSSLEDWTTLCATTSSPILRRSLQRASRSYVKRREDRRENQEAACITASNEDYGRATKMSAAPGPREPNLCNPVSQISSQNSIAKYWVTTRR